MITTTTHIILNAAWIADRWTALHESRLKGTPRPWKQTTLTPEQAAAYDAQHRAEKRAHGAPAGADSQAPLHLDVLDLLVSIERTATWVANTIQNTGINATPNGEDTYNRLRYISTYALVLAEDDPTTEQAEQELRNHRHSIEREWAQIVIGQRLKAPCPWCGQEQLIIRAIGPEDRTEMVVRCESGTCNPDETSCGTWYGGKPCWPFHEWEWLSNRIDNAIGRGNRTGKPVIINYAKH